MNESIRNKIIDLLNFYGIDMTNRETLVGDIETLVVDEANKMKK